MKTLDLVLKHKWYDMIASHIKLEEYRNINPYWTRRITQSCLTCNRKKIVKHCLEECDALHDKILFNKFDCVKFHRGYTSTTITFRIKEIVIATGNPEWGAENGKEYYVIRLDEELKEEKE